MKTLLALVILLLTGCASDLAFVEAQGKSAIAFHEARASAAASEAFAVQAIATSNASDVSKAMGFMAMMANKQGVQAAAPQIHQPQNQALGWAGVVMQGLGLYSNYRIAAVNSDNSVLNTQSNNSVLNTAFGKIQAPGAVTTTTTNTTNTLAGTGVLGTGTYTTDSHNTDSHNTDSHLVNPTPVVFAPSTKVCTVDATGVLTCQ